MLPDGTRLLGVHASPGGDAGAGVEPQMSDGELASLVAGCEHWLAAPPTVVSIVVSL